MLTLSPWYPALSEAAFRWIMMVSFHGPSPPIT
jgi:hypothetical protein